MNILLTAKISRYNDIKKNDFSFLQDTLTIRLLTICNFGSQ